MYQIYRRDLALEYAKQFLQVQNPLYPDMRSIGSNNVNYIYQVLEAGGFYSKNSSNYLDVERRNFYPAITRVDNFLKSLDEELRAIKYTSTDINSLPGSQTGDILMTNRQGYKTFYLIEFTNLERFYYSKTPNIFRQLTLPNADEYSLYLLPDYIGEF